MDTFERASLSGGVGRTEALLLFKAFWYMMLRRSLLEMSPKARRLAWPSWCVYALAFLDMVFQVFAFVAVRQRLRVCANVASVKLFILLYESVVSF